MKVSAVNSHRLNSLHFEGKKAKEVQKPVHSSNPIKAIPVAVLIAMSPINAPKIDASPVAAKTEAVAVARPTITEPQSFVESKKFSNDNNYYFVGVVKDNQNGNYKIWIESVPKIHDYGDADADLYGLYGLHGYVSEFNNNAYKITDELGIKASQFNFRNIYIFDKDETRDDGIVNPEVCDYVEEIMKKYPTNIKVNNNKYTSTLNATGCLDVRRFANIGWYGDARENPTNYGTPMMSWDIETPKGKYAVRIYNNDSDNSNFETVTIQRENGPELKANSLIANNTYISSQRDKISTEEFYQVNVSHPKFGEHALVNKELWEFLAQIYGVTENHNAIGTKRLDIDHLYMLPNGVISKGL